MIRDGTATPRAASRSDRGRRMLLALAAIGTWPLFALAGGWFYLRHSAASTLRQAIADADRLDPGWRLAQLEAKRKVIPDERNSALQVQATLAELPEDWLQPQTNPPAGDIPRGWELFQSLDIPSDMQLSSEQIAALRAELGEFSTALAKARALAEMPEGRPHVVYARVWFNTQFPHANDSRTVSRLLKMDAVLRAHDGDIDGALDSCRALLNAGRSLGDDPSYPGQLYRIAIGWTAIMLVERVLAQGEASDAALAKVQALLDNEAKTPFLLTGLRGQRAGYFDMFGKLVTDEVSIAEIREFDAKLRPPLKTGPQRTLFFQYNQGLALDFMNHAVEIAKRPVREQVVLWGHWEDYTREPTSTPQGVAGALAYLLVPGTATFVTNVVRAGVDRDIALTMIALERYRLAHGRWPESLDALVPSLLPEVPDDPYARRPLRLVKRGDGVVVYSIGLDGQDNDGTISMTDRHRRGVDLGLQLWDVSQRRKPAEPPAAPADSPPSN